MPRIFGCQSTGSAAIYNAYKSGKEEIIPVQATTMADSISVNLPSDGLRALRAATETNGAYVAVDDQKILEAISEPGRSGYLCRTSRSGSPGRIEGSPQGWAR